MEPGAAATVGGTRITEAELANQVEAILKAQGRPADAADADLTTSTLSRMVTVELVEQASAQAGISITQGEIDTALAGYVAQAGQQEVEKIFIDGGIAPTQIESIIVSICEPRPWVRFCSRMRSRRLRALNWSGSSASSSNRGRPSVRAMAVGTQSPCRSVGVLAVPPASESRRRSPSVAGDRLAALMDRLRSPGGCPWTPRQTHESLVEYLVEESYETVEAIESPGRDGLREELGDLLLQVAFHFGLPKRIRSTRWSIDDVAQGIIDKLIRRHPHVFDDQPIGSDAEA
jgi:NTP pyrophosphatase (non-canonical NTP hydrolase)